MTNIFHFGKNYALISFEKINCDVGEIWEKICHEVFRIVRYLICKHLTKFCTINQIPIAQ